MTKVDLLIEIGCEEIPARMLPAASESLAEVLVSLLDGASLARGEPRVYWSPRRLAVLVPETASATEPTEETVLGPPARAAWDAAGQPTKAATGFARKQGLAAEELVRVETERGEYAAATIRREARGIGAVLTDGFERAVAGISFPKTMRWGDGIGSFVRPVHWLVALAGEEVLDLSLFGVRAGRLTWGHRILAPEPIEIPAAQDWLPRLSESFIVVDPVERRERLRTALDKAAGSEGGELVEDDELLREVADMVELPAATAGSFEVKFVEQLPAEVLQTCLKHHQKAFSVRDGGRVLPRFAVAVNMPSDPEGHIRRGHEWVNSGRLEDALFFWREDRRRTLASRADELEGVVFQRELGTYAAKSRRLERLVAVLASGLSPGVEDLAPLVRAAQLCRCDLVSGLVGEFPELQGVAAGLLARADGEDEAVAAAVYDLYRPASVEDDLPRTLDGLVLGLADRLDTLAGGFAVGLVPSGSRDPFALRRAGTATVRLAAEAGVDLEWALREAVAGYDGGERGPDLRASSEETISQLGAFLRERFGALAERDGARYDEIAAVRAVSSPVFLPADLFSRARALRAFRQSEDFLALASAAKRVRNILAQAREWGVEVTPGQNAEALALEQETELAANLERAGQNVADLRRREDYRGALGELAGLRGVLDRFFDDVLVMDEDPTRRAARLGLLATFGSLAHEIVDLSELVVEGK